MNDTLLHETQVNPLSINVSISLFTQSQFDDKIQLGPRAQLSWVKGSSGGAKASNSGMYL